MLGSSSDFFSLSTLLAITAMGAEKARNHWAMV